MLWWPHWGSHGSILPGCIFWVINAVLLSRSPILNSGVNQEQRGQLYSQPWVWSYCKHFYFPPFIPFSIPLHAEMLYVLIIVWLKVWTAIINLPLIHYPYFHPAFSYLYSQHYEPQLWRLELTNRHGQSGQTCLVTFQDYLWNLQRMSFYLIHVEEKGTCMFAEWGLQVFHYACVNCCTMLA